MNGNKVLNRLIQVFVAVNILLLIINTAKMTTSYVLAKERITNIISILNARGVIVDVSLPRVFTPKKQGAIIIADNTSESRERLVKALICPNLEEVRISSEASGDGYKRPSRYTKDNISLIFADAQITYEDAHVNLAEPVTLKTAEAMCKRFIHKAGLSKIFKNAYVEDASTDGAAVLIFYPKYEGIPIFDSYIRFEVGKDGVAKAVMHVARIADLQSNYARRLIYPIDIVLFGIEDSLELPEPAHITNIVLGYHSLNTEGMDILEQEIIPTYKITIDGLNEPVFVNAYTNKAIK